MLADRHNQPENTMKKFAISLAAGASALFATAAFAAPLSNGMTSLPDGTPSLRMRNKPPRMEKVTLPDGRPAIQLGAKTVPQMEMITLPDGTASLRISDKSMRPASEIPAPK